MKKRILVMVLGISILGIVGCKTAEQPEKAGGSAPTEEVTLTESPVLTERVEPTEVPTPTNKAETSVLEDGPFDLEKIRQSGQQIQDYYVWSVQNDNSAARKIEMGANTPVELIMEMESMNDTEVGYMIFVDGVPQTYEIGGKESYLIPLECASGISEETLTFTPVVPESKDEYTAYFVCINRPNFRVSES